MSALFGSIVGVWLEITHLPHPQMLFDTTRLGIDLDSLIQPSSLILLNCSWSRVVNLAPTRECADESINSIRFAQMVHKVDLGPARKLAGSGNGLRTVSASLLQS